jgi:ATP-dependent RNA helicase DDX10/DBP4
VKLLLLIITIPTSIADEDSEEDDLFKSTKRAEISGDEDEYIVEQQLSLGSSDRTGKVKKPKSKAAIAKKLMKKNIQTNKIVVFDEEGGAVPDLRKERQSDMAKSYEREDVSGIDIERAKEILKEEDQYDKQIFRERIRAKHR